MKTPIKKIHKAIKVPKLANSEDVVTCGIWESDLVEIGNWKGKKAIKLSY